MKRFEETDGSRMETRLMYIWDLPTRIFHWGLVATLLVTVATGIFGGDWMAWHGRAGLAIVGLLSFRLIWGMVGSTYARFKTFWPSLSKLSSHLRGEWIGVGHNPLGAISVLVLLGVLAIQALSGLCANDGLAFNGYLYPLVSNDMSDLATTCHRYAANLLYVLVALHVGAIAFYLWVKHKNLVTPMITGFGDGSRCIAEKRGGQTFQFCYAFIVACICVYFASGLWLTGSPQTQVNYHQADW